MYSENMVIISKRWPKIGEAIVESHYDLIQIQLIEDIELSIVFDQIQIASSYNQIVEANKQISSLPQKSDFVTLYGVGLGQVPAQLLKRYNLNRLNVVILNFSLLKASLHYFDFTSWLVSPKLNLLKGAEIHILCPPFIALPAELTLASNDCAQLRDRVCLSLDHEFINKNKGINNTQLQEKIYNNRNNILIDFDVSNLFLSRTSYNFIVCGAGPTLDNFITWLKKESTQNDFILIAVDAAVMSLSKAGIIPDIVVSIDPVAKKLLDCLDLSLYVDTPLVYFPVVKTSLLSLWQGPKYTAYSTGELYDDVNIKFPKGRLYCGGSVIHPAIDLSVKMGAKKVVLLGADFSFPKGRTHAYWHNDELLNGTHLAHNVTSHWVLNGLNERVPTLLNYRGYLRDLEQYIALTNHVEFFNSSLEGAFIEGTTIWPNF